MYKISPATAAKRDLRLIPNAMAAKMAASSIAEAPIPNIFIPANDIATTNEVMPATTSAAHIPPVMAFSAPVTSETSSQYHLLLMAYASSSRTYWYGGTHDRRSVHTAPTCLGRPGSLPGVGKGRQ